MIPVIDAGADDDRTFSFGLFCGRSPFPSELDDVGAIDTGKLLLPGRGVDPVAVIIVRVLASQASINAELRHDQIVNRGDRDPALRSLQIAYWYSSLNRITIGEIVKQDLQDILCVFQQRKSRGDF